MKQKNKTPKDWQTIKLNNLFEAIPNLSNTREDLTDIAQDVMYIHYGDIHTNSIHEKINLKKDTLPYLLNNKIEKNIDDMFLKNGDVIITDASEDYEGIGKAVEIISTNNKKIVAGLHTIVLRPIKNILSIGYGSYLLQMPITSKKLKAISQGTKVISISFQLIKDLDIFLPPIKEQEKIVEILELWDKAIETTKKLIEQKQLQKKYLMQKLLTGKIRLKGFKNKRGKKSVKDFGIVITGNTPSKTNINYYGNALPWVTAEDFNNKYILDTKIKLSELGKKQARILPKGSVLVTCIASIGLNAIAGVELATNQQINSIIPNKNYDSDFLYYLFSFNTLYIKNYASPGGLSILPKSVFEKIIFKIPTDKNEQKAIADILSTADKQIDLLEQKLSKLELQKKGLMQKFLTGKIRVGR